MKTVYAMDSNNKNFDNYIKGLLKQDKSFSADSYKLEYPSMYSIVLQDVSDTPRDFMVFVMQNIFHKSKAGALTAAKAIEKEDRLVMNLYTRDVAETKIAEITELSLDNGYSLKCLMQKGRQNVIEES